ncbi:MULTISPECIES: hypothetical protein [Myxococcus]|uniref:Lipoprotein n=1 Tax=Myxococcus xanthus (strain DK1622) TaxID=246197 RepID=Q1CWD5_MYXXD|nr:MULTISPECIES: hypothetical protein [Myxococcus]ABF92141.1 hypothetical protein MXAN_7175 [Myxococcus xanthus DK 1622]NOJ51630.1 hypothetical protein [Myxococcus xanthus]NOK02240.1 hypothetical protein [Myxococcus xanthus]QPM79437.1 hypothetical protein I5Q59_35320 [Myxococcus xanthus]QVW68517.1 hypothetical protein JTM82_02850 [Myxococcus xanthus DZ2]
MNTLTKFLAGTAFLFSLTFAPGAQAQECYEACGCNVPCNRVCTDNGQPSRCGLAGAPCLGDCAKNDPQASASDKKASDKAAPACGQQQTDKASEEAES